MNGAIGNIQLGLGAIGKVSMSKGYIGRVPIYSAGNMVTYYVDTGVTYTEEVDSDETVLSPKTFIPAKSGWEFVGWRQDTTASSSVLSTLTMGDNPITLYAVFRQLVTVTYYNGNTTKKTATGYRYYNNSNTVNPAFTIAQAALSGWTARGWSIGTTGNAAISYTAINNTAFSADITLYGMYYLTITLSYNANGGSGTVAAQSGYRYYNSGSAAYVNPSFTIKANGFTRSGYNFARWRLNGTSGTAYSPNASITLSGNATLYAEWTYVGAPFYIIQNGLCKRWLGWSISGNLSTPPKNENSFVADITWNKVIGTNGTAQSSSIATAGNNTLQIATNSSSNAQLQVYDQSGNKLLDTGYTGSGTWTVNIAGKTSVYFKVTIGSNYGEWQPGTIYFY